MSDLIQEKQLTGFVSAKMSDLIQEKQEKITEAARFSGTASDILRRYYIYKCNGCGRRWGTEKGDGSQPSTCNRCRQSCQAIESREIVHNYYKCDGCGSEWTGRHTGLTRCYKCGTARWTKVDPKIQSGQTRIADDAPIDEYQFETLQRIGEELEFTSQKFQPFFGYRPRLGSDPGTATDYGSYGRHPSMDLDKRRKQAKADRLFDRGNIYLAEENYELAVKMYTEAIDLSPRHRKAYYHWRSQAYMKLSKSEEAEQDMLLSLQDDVSTASDLKRTLTRRRRASETFDWSVRMLDWSSSSDTSDEITDEGVDVGSPVEKTFRNIKIVGSERSYDYEPMETHIQRESEESSKGSNTSTSRREPEIMGHDENQETQITGNDPGELTGDMGNVDDVKDEEVSDPDCEATQTCDTSESTRKPLWQSSDPDVPAIPATIVRRFRIHSWLSTRPRNYIPQAFPDEPSSDDSSALQSWVCGAEYDEDEVSEADSMEALLPELPDLSSVQDDGAAEIYHTSLSDRPSSTDGRPAAEDELGAQSDAGRSSSGSTGEQQKPRVHSTLKAEVGAGELSGEGRADSVKTDWELKEVETYASVASKPGRVAECNSSLELHALEKRMSTTLPNVIHEQHIIADADKVPETIVRRFRIHSWLSTRPRKSSAPTTTGVPEGQATCGQSPPRVDQDEEDEDQESETDSMDTQLPELPDLSSAEENGTVKADLLAHSMSAAGASRENTALVSTEQVSSRSSDVMDARPQPKTRVSLLSHSSDNADGQSPGGSSDSSGTGRVVEQAKAGVNLPSGSECSADPDEQDICGLIQGRDRERRRTIDLSHHDGTPDSFMLVKATSSLHVDTVTEVGELRFERNHRFFVEAIDGVEESDARSMASIAVSRDFVVVRLGNQLRVYDIMRNNVMERGKTLTDDVVDIAGMGCVVYCLSRTGNVTEYSIPDLEQTRRITFLMQERGGEFTKIATCSKTFRTAILSVNHQTSVIKVYDDDWVCFRTVHFSELRASWYLGLCGDELFVDGEVEIMRSVFYINYSRPAAAVVGLRCYDPAQAICHIDTDRVLVVTRDDFSEREFVRQLDLKFIRKRSRNCLNVDSAVMVRREDLPWAPAFGFEGFAFNTLISSIRINNCGETLLEMSDSGRVTEYIRDVSRPGHVETLSMYRFRLPTGIKVRRFDISDEGEVVMISPDGRLLIFSTDRKLRWYDIRGQTAWDVMCTPGTIYVLLDDSVVVYVNENCYTVASRRLSGGLENHDPHNTRLVVYEHVLYLLVPGRRHILSMNLLETDPSFAEFVQIPHVVSRCLAVTRDGEVLVGGAWVDRTTGTQKAGLIVFSPNGMPISRWVPVESEGEDDTLNMDSAFRREGGLYFMTSLGSLKFLDNF